LVVSLTPLMMVLGSVAALGTRTHPDEGAPARIVPVIMLAHLPL
jgi:hypothetical protein